eukprot:TRINITY_DN64366_c0_g1_i1.p1 TRINITY_DN64366_c0_g1~~TRINITY_DN64366_c0_g1_i1.p1  ORF type:complete len:391 (+),score=80.02 TRINITY_DN64366_c0_g1_i1:38-1210(+)
MAGAEAAPASEFLARKRQILASLDKSPKGSLDAPIVDFLSWLNEQTTVVTTSSCSGRIAVFLGSSDASSSKGGTWLLSSHGPVESPLETWASVLSALAQHQKAGTAEGQLVTLLLEPFVLHAECADVATAQQILGVAREAGFRESGISHGRRRVMVQIRTLAMRLEVPLALDGKALVDQPYFQTLIQIANSRLAENMARVNRLWRNLQEALQLSSNSSCDEGEPWVLVCPSALARSVKLALEDRQWLDESRKMQPFEGSEHGPSTNCSVATIGIPLTQVAAKGFVAMSDQDVEGDEVHARAVAGVVEEPVAKDTSGGMPGFATKDCISGAGGKKQKPPILPADLEALWRQRKDSSTGIRLVQHAGLPTKSKPVQRGYPSPSGSAAQQKKP